MPIFLSAPFIIKILNLFIIILYTHLYHNSFQYLSITWNAFIACYIRCKKYLIGILVTPIKGFLTIYQGVHITYFTFFPMPLKSVIQKQLMLFQKFLNLLKIHQGQDSQSSIIIVFSTSFSLEKCQSETKIVEFWHWWISPLFLKVTFASQKDFFFLLAV